MCSELIDTPSDDSEYTASLEIELRDLPIGYISHKVINGNDRYYRQWKENGKVKSQYVKPECLDELKDQISRRKEIEAELKAYSYANTREAYKRLSSYARMFLGNAVSIGCQDYEVFIKNKHFYVDKTGFLYKWWKSNDQITLILRPRRFGKTLNMSMVNCFFSSTYEGRSDLFERSDVWKHKEMHGLQGTCPVIFMSFASIKSSTADEMLVQFRNILHGILLKYTEVISASATISDIEKQSFQFYLQEKDFYSKLHGMCLLCGLLCKHYGRKVILLLDEYDTPFTEAVYYHIWDKIAPYMRSLFVSLFKDNSFIEKALITGITRIGRESLFSDLNNLSVYSCLNSAYGTYFGFTEAEVRNALTAQGITDFDKVKEWYDGFEFGDVKDIYNPWSISNYLRNHEFDTYWVNSSSTRLISDYFRVGNEQLKYDLEVLISGESVTTQIDEYLVYDDISNNRDALFSLLTAAGYFKPVSRLDGQNYEIKAVNKEVRIMLTAMVKRWFNDGSELNSFILALTTDDVEYMNIYLNRITASVFSYFDTAAGNGSEPERFYHGFVLGLIVNLRGRYTITSNRESGLGRFDISLEPCNKSADHAIIIEFKVKRKSESSLEDSADNALNQIEEKNYEESLISHGIRPDNIYKYGFSFEGKKVLVKGKHQWQ